jgi:hypothetical protein
MLTQNKELRKLIREMERAGLDVTKAGKHLKIRNPETGAQVSIPSTPRGGTRTWLNMLTEVKRGVGFDYRTINK